MEIKQTRSLFRQTLSAWSDDYAPSMGAALAYYTMFSIAPLLLIIIAVAGWVFGAEAARGEILAQLDGLMGKEGATMIEGLLKSVSEPDKSATAAAAEGSAPGQNVVSMCASDKQRTVAVLTRTPG